MRSRSRTQERPFPNAVAQSRSLLRQDWTDEIVRVVVFSFDLAVGIADHLADGFGSISHRVIEQVSIALGGLHLGVPQHLPDQRQRGTGRHQDARKRMAKVMDPNIRLPNEGWFAILAFGGAAIATDLLNLHRKTCPAANAGP